MDERVLGELRAGSKRTHWIWFIFPQIAGLGRSATSAKFAISSPAEATAYLTHPVLGARLREGSALMMGIEGRSAEVILGRPDDAKFHSSMTLFAQVAGADPVFLACLEKYFEGRPDPHTLSRLRSRSMFPSPYLGVYGLILALTGFTVLSFAATERPMRPAMAAPVFVVLFPPLGVLHPSRAITGA